MTTPPKPHDTLTWADHGHCKGKGHLFFADLAPEGNNGRPKIANYDAARAICQGCPVRPQCLEHALTRPEKHGFWGGYDPTELKDIRNGRLEAA